MAVFRACVPEAPIDKDGHFLRGEDKIRFHCKMGCSAIGATDRDVPSPSRDPFHVKYSREPQLRASIPSAPDCRHHL
jgi:hypothetical protein